MAIALLNKPDEHVHFGAGELEEPFLLALTADRLLALVYDELSEPRSFKAPLNRGNVRTPHLFLAFVYELSSAASFVETAAYAEAFLDGICAFEREW